MGGKTKIEWTDTTWNPVRGCTKVSPGCKHCYAESFAERFRGVQGHPYEQGFDLRIVPEKLLEPFFWPRSSMVFVNSMSDLFHPEIPDEYILRVAEIMLEANWHTYQVLTKRAERLRHMLNGALRLAAAARHIWWGVSVEDSQYGKPRIEHLRGSLAVRAAAAHARWSHPGSKTSLHNARPRRFLSSSNNGAACTRKGMAASFTVARTMNSRRVQRNRFPIAKTGSPWPHSRSLSP
jgi:DNA repair photolyase